MMKYILALLLICSSLVPTPSRADIVTYEEAWAFSYEFPLSWGNGQLVLASRYRISSGENPVIPPGPWLLVIRDGAQESLAAYPFDPAVLGVNGEFVLKVPAQDRGATATFHDAAGQSVLSVDVRGSRVCNDDGACNGPAGENRKNCPTDCGYQAAAGVGSVKTAAISDQLTLGARLGDILMRLGFGAAGVMLLVGMARMLDSRRRA